jgi:hypothetical protein
MGLKENNGKANGKKSGKAGKAIRAGNLTSSLMLDQWMAFCSSQLMLLC